MNNRESFEKWYIENVACYLDLPRLSPKELSQASWQAACEYQKDKDAKILQAEKNDWKHHLLNDAVDHDDRIMSQARYDTLREMIEAIRTQEDK